MSMAEMKEQNGSWGLFVNEEAIKRKKPQVRKLLEKISSRSDNNGFMCLLSLRLLRLDDNEIMKLWNDCADQNMNKLDRTLTMLVSGNVFTTKEIKENLESEKPIPFIDETVNNMEGIPAYGQKFDCGHKNWNMFCETNKNIFDEKRKQKPKVLKMSR